jgi:STE24 endopeptidase
LNEDRASRYHRLKRTVGIVSLAWGVSLMVLLLATGGSVGLRRLAGGHVLPFVVLLSLVNEMVALPLAFYSGFVLERRYGLSNETLAGWTIDQLKSFALGIVLGGGAAQVIYWCIGAARDRWWLVAGPLFAAVVIGLATLGPVVFLPLFYATKPLSRDDLRERLLRLAERAGARVLGAYEWGLGEKTKKANAALAGIGATRRILVSDTMLAEYSDDEIEVVLAHELAHHVHGDIWKGIAFESVLIVAGFFLASRVLEAFVTPLGLAGVDDAAGLPLLLLAAGGVSLVMVPFAHAMSRAFERSADRFALDLTGNPSAFISAMRRLGAQNLAEEHPSRLVQMLFYSHPPLRERIAAAEAYRG